MKFETRYEGPQPTGSFAQDLINRLLVVTSAAHATTVESDLYFIEVADQKVIDGPIKIGVSRSVVGRLSALQTSCPYRLVVRRIEPRLGLIERTLHRIAAEHRTHGEWFEPTPLVRAIADNQMPANLALALPAPGLGKPWGDVRPNDYEAFIEQAWTVASGSTIWRDSQRLVRDDLRGCASVGDAYKRQVTEDALWGEAA